MSFRKKKCIVVLGMHRSGTSAMTGILNTCGLYLGKELFPPRDDNPTGFFENARVLDFNDELLGALGSFWEDEFDLPHEWLLTPEVQGIKRRIGEFGISEFGDHPAIAIKDPRLCLTLPLWEDALQGAGFEMYYVIMLRHPTAVAKSLQVRNRFSCLRSHLLWMKYIRSAERFTRQKNRVFVRFDDLVKDPLRVSEIVLERSGFSRSWSGMTTKEQIGEFISTDLYHHKHIERLDTDIIHSIVYDLYLLLVGAVELNLDDDGLHRAVDDLLLQYDEETSFLRHPYLASEIRSLNRQIHKLERHIVYQEQLLRSANNGITGLPRRLLRRLANCSCVDLLVRRCRREN